MIPSTTLGLLIAVTALSPGYVYLRYARKRTPRVERSTVEEAAAFLLGGSLASGVAAIAVLGAGEIFPIFVDVGDWSSGGSAYLRDRPWVALVSVLVTFVLSMLVAQAAAWLVHLQLPVTISAHPVWWSVFRERGTSLQVQVAVTLDDGRILEGQVHAYSTGEPQTRDIALRQPLGLWDNGQFRSIRGVHRILLSASHIREIDIRYVDSDGATTDPLGDPKKQRRRWFRRLR